MEKAFIGARKLLLEDGGGRYPSPHDQNPHAPQNALDPSSQNPIPHALFQGHFKARLTPAPGISRRLITRKPMKMSRTCKCAITASVRRIGTAWGSACSLRARMDLRRASDRMGRTGDSSHRNHHYRLVPALPEVAAGGIGLGRCPSEGEEAAAVAVAVACLAAAWLRSQRGWERARRQQTCRWDLGRRAYRLEHRTLVLYSRNQSRTNRALCHNRGRSKRDNLPS
jgi:hypothetical protein